MRTLAAIPIALFFASPALAQDTCTSRADCSEGYRCLRNTCVDEAIFAAAQPRETKTEALDDNVHVLLSGALGMVLPAISRSAGEGVQLAMRGGILYRGFQFELELAPATAMFGIFSSPFYMFEVVGTVGYFAPMTDMVSWIIRAGGGGGGVFGTPQFGVASFGELRLDVVGVAIQTSKHVFFELNVPSFRLLFLPTSNYMAMWVTNVAFDYAF